MGLLNFFTWSKAAELRALPSGSFTLSPAGELISSTVSLAYPVGDLLTIGRLVLETFQQARTVQLPAHELRVRFAGLDLLAREQRGGAIIYLTPQSLPTASSPLTCA
jgi:hypothetical protein